MSYVVERTQDKLKDFERYWVKMSIASDLFSQGRSTHNVVFLHLKTYTL